MAEAQFPPSTQVPLSIRVQEIEGTRFLAVRKAASELYLNPDNTPLMSYGDTLLDRQKVKDAVLAYELSKGWVLDDRGGQVTAAPQPIAAPVAQIPSAPVIGFQPQMPQPPAGAVAMPTMMQMTTALPPAPQTMAPAPQAPPEAAPMEMPVGKARRGRPAALGSAVAPPPPAPTQTLEAPMSPPVPVAPPQMQMAPPVPGIQAPPAVPLPPMPPQATQGNAGPSMDLSGLSKSLSEFAQSLSEFKTSSATDFKQLVGNLSAQINETNKALTNIQETQKRHTEALATSFVALHHLYLNAVQSPNKPTALPEFEALLKQYLPR